MPTKAQIQNKYLSPLTVIVKMWLHSIQPTSARLSTDVSHWVL